ncbi:hypothetical protein EAG18_18355 [Pseudoalteromonas sp. J010]|uniref:hypothetical protein n=1 Tax=Pseudoalteromonas sp. J010 TaxID=998465 RepID=UPI000F64DDB7|nr:hypothetical protein [Pseudoalteromonas sp. J010]RRS07218.1 hypothetical protein EAG18_18355 [Pseudoalteromonas sp. J010]
MKGTITEKMKNHFLLEMLSKYKNQSKNTHILEYEFLMTDLSFVRNLPMLFVDTVAVDTGSLLAQVVEHLKKDGYLESNNLKFKFTEKGAEKANNLSDLSNEIEELENIAPPQKVNFWSRPTGVVILGLVTCFIFWLIQTNFLSELRAQT